MRITTLLLIFFTLFSCKKEEPIAPLPPGVPPADGSVSYATSYSGILQLFQVYQATDADTLALAGFLTPHVSFSQSAMTYLQNASVATVDSVLFNNVKMTYDGSYYYEDNTYTTYNAPYIWQVYGNSTIPSFTFTNQNSLPTYTGCAVLPDSAKPGKVLGFNLTGISGYSKVVCFLSDGVGGSIFREFSNTNGVIPVSFSESETANLTVGSTFIGVWIIKDNVRYFGGKSFNFTTDLIISKPVYVQ